MPIPSFYSFNQLPVQTQIGIVVFEGTFLCNPLGEEGDYINLYHMGDFFAELYYDAEMNVLHDCRTFRSVTQLQVYADRIDIQKLLQERE
ncbi:hypothetical protein [Hymenobacter pini]|uniref:hypothetical protein n=1 Tax=Hymenobacter pini TaxID=2880879 RepID=UPI001CF172A9|nr:hypothetical protein [Hymenobacter pini]MCA8830272.1 hypothetical protein [Hymenobacter pini]